MLILLFCVGRHIHVSIRDPAVVYSMTATSDSMHCVDISDLFPYPTSIFSPKLNLVGLNHEFEGQLLLHDVNVSIYSRDVASYM